MNRANHDVRKDAAQDDKQGFDKVNKETLDQEHAEGSDVRHEEGSDEDIQVVQYQRPRWVDAQWKIKDDKGDLEVPQPVGLIPPNMTTREIDATPITKTSPLEARSARATGRQPVYSPTKVSQDDMVDLDLEALVQPTVHDFSSNKPRFFASHPAPISIQDKDDDDDDDEPSSTGLDVAGPPMSNIYEIFDDMAAKAVDVGLCHKIPSKKLRIFTMCSGTEAPLLAMKIMQQSLERRGQQSILFDHLASVENEPFKQAFIQRNYNPLILFRDVTEFTENGDPHTAYGGTAAQPEDVDILIAGTVCKDYSTLNNMRKPFGQEGKSYNTLTGLVGYASRHRPKIIILENVKGAPWWQFREYLGSIGYEALAVHVDTKNFYLPQTRQRGYLVAFDTKRFPSNIFDIELALNNWTGFMQHFQRRATSPFTDFLLPDDDPYLHQAKLAVVTAKTKGGTSWDACRHRHAKFRVLRQCGLLRPMTKWQTNGSCLFPDFGWTLWAKRQRERIWDTLDIELLLHAGDRGYDMNHKGRWLELSQNVDRVSDKLQWGIVSCITPNGLPYLTIRGGPVVGKELLSLQGIPVDDLDLNKEKPTQLQDLAGNAMSTPVVGAAIFSAIMAAQSGMVARNHCFFTDEVRELKNQGEWRELAGMDNGKAHPNHLLALERSELWKRMAAFTTKVQNVNADSLGNVLKDDLLQLAGKTVQLCECETIPDAKVGTFMICRLCGHTACSVCGGNPEHEYREIPADIVKRRLPASNFMEAVWNALPTALRLSETNSIVADLDPQLQHAASEACSRPMTFRHIKRSRCWKVTYESSHAILEVHFVRKCNPGAVSINDFVGATSIDYYWLLFAKADPKLTATHPLRSLLTQPIARMNECVTLLQGEWATPRYETVRLSIHPPVGDISWTHAWEAKLSLQQEAFRNLEVPMIQIVEVVSSPKGEANVNASKLEGEYSLLPKCGGASRTLHIRQDKRSGPPMFFYLDPEPLKNASKDAFVFANTHHRRVYKETRVIYARVCKGWRPESRQSHNTDGHRAFVRESQVEASVVVWKKQPNTYLAPYMHQPQPEMLTPVSLQSFASQTVDCKAGLFSLMLLEVPLLEGELGSFRGHQYSVLLSEEDSALQPFAWMIKRATPNIPNLGHWQRLSVIDSATEICTRCVPIVPTIEYRRTKTVIIAREKEKEAIEYESALKARPRPLMATMHCHADHAILNVEVNLCTLLHRVVAKISSRSSAIEDQINVRWRLSLDEGHKIAPPFKIQALQSNVEECPIVPDVAIFIRPLWREQQQALAWMVRHELKPCEWQEREQEVVRVQGLGLRVDVEAHVQKTVFGGVLADEVGAGKTTTSFALIARMLNEDVQFPEDDYSFALKATLILVPKDLIQQWQDEFKRCFGRGTSLKSLFIKTTNDLMKQKLVELKKLDIIIAPWNIFDQNNYWTNLANLCGARNKPASAGRAFQKWLREALKDSRQMVKDSGRSDTSSIWTRPTSSNEKYNAFVGGARKPLGNLQQGPGFRPLFHLFRFRRLIVDEYSYLRGFSFLGILEIRAVSKWMLSGTPPLATFDAVNTTAKLIGTHLSGEDECDGCLSFVTNGQKLRNEQSEAEDFHYHQERHSAPWYRSRYELASDFVQTFIRKNQYKRKDWKPPIHHLELSHLTAMEKITYLEVYQDLMSQGTSFNHSYSLEQLLQMSRGQRIGACVSMSRGPEDALLSCCSDMRASVRTCADVLEDKKNDVVLTIGKLYKTLEDMFHYAKAQTDEEDLEQDNTHFLSYKLRVYNKDFGDESTATLVDMLMYLAYQALSPPPQSSATMMPKSTKALTNNLAKKEIKARANAMKNLATNLNTHTTQLVDEIRSLRFFRNVMRGLEGQKSLICVGCASLSTPKDANIIGTCGHIVCNACLGSEDRARDNPDTCVTPFCIAPALPHHIIQISQLSTDLVLRGGEAGSKMSAVVEKTKHIIQNSKDKVLIFVQLPRIAAALLEALDGAGVAYTDVTNLRPPKAKVMGNSAKGKCKTKGIAKEVPRTESTGSTSEMPVTPSKAKASMRARAKPKRQLDGLVESFKTDGGARVCILMLESVDAAGWNLQCANHVMFVAALTVESQQRYNAVMKQAIGRCDRFGQDKEVHVYHFLMAKTVEVNIWQGREGKKIVWENGFFSAVEADDEPGEFEGPGLEGAACGAGDNRVDDEEDGRGDDAEAME